VESLSASGVLGPRRAIRGGASIAPVVIVTVTVVVDVSVPVNTTVPDVVTDVYTLTMVVTVAKACAVDVSDLVA
jgi:hypothetical protein